MINNYNSCIGWHDCEPVQDTSPTYRGINYDKVYWDECTMWLEPKPQDPKLLQLLSLAKLRRDKQQIAYLEKRLMC